MDEAVSTAGAVGVDFHRVKQGYSAQEVDVYVQLLSKEYTKLLSELEDAREKNMALFEETQELKAELNRVKKNPAQDKMDAISRALVKAEAMAQDIISGAEKEVCKAKQDALQDVEKERQSLINELDELKKAKRDALLQLGRINRKINDIIDQRGEKCERKDVKPDTS